MITELEFKSLASQGFNRIPLITETLADLETPLSLYLKLPGALGQHMQHHRLNQTPPQVWEQILDLWPPERQHHQWMLFEFVQRRINQLDRQRICPVKIFENQQHRLLGRCHPQP